MKHKKYAPNIADWGIEAVEEINRCLEKQILAAVNEALGYAFEDDETYIYFPVEWIKGPGDEREGTDGIGGKEVADPLTVYLRVGLYSGDNKPTYEFNIREALQDTMAACKEDGSYSTGLGRLSEALKALASDIDAAREI